MSLRSIRATFYACEAPMKIARFSTFGRPEAVIECVEVADPPAPKADEVALEVLAFPLNPADLLTIEGLYAVRPPLPACPGAECVGRVQAVGDAVDDLREGDLGIPLDREN